MKTLYKISHNKEDRPAPTPFHSHDFYEIYFFVEGNVTYYVEDECYDLAQGDILLISPGRLHRPIVQNSLPYDRYVLFLYKELIASDPGFSALFSHLEELVCQKNTRRLSLSEDSYSYLKELFDTLLSLQEGLSHSLVPPSSVPLLSVSCPAMILQKISREFSLVSSSSYQSKELVPRVISYLNAHIKDAPSLQELSNRFFVSPYYLSHRFKEYTKTSLHQYILLKKINLAKQLLTQGLPPHAVCDACGFSTYSNFYKEFRQKTGVSPGKYRE